MAEVIRMPLLSDTMKEGVIAEWHKKVGDLVKADDVIAEVETDKATMEVMPYVDGTLLYIGVEKGKGVPVNGVMAIIGKPGEDFQALLGGTNAPTTVSAAPAVGANASAAAPAPVVATSTASVAVADTSADAHLKASPLAKKIASEKGVDLSKLHGTGDGGRIIKRDIDQMAAAPVATAPASVPTPATVAPATGQDVDTPLTQMRKIIAQRLAESMFSAPHFYLKMSVEMDKAADARKAINNFTKSKISFNDLIIKACAMALRKHPAINSSWMGDFIRQHAQINIGTAVAVDEGLIVPVIRSADIKSLTEISAEAATLIEKARTKKIQPQEFTGNTFTISNLGMMDIDEFTAIINPPDACILAIGKITPTPVVVGEQVVVRQIMKLTLSCDHRVVDGAKGAAFLQTLKTYLENPATMLA